MRLLADECCDALLVQELRAGGHDVEYAKESMRGSADHQVLKSAFESDRYVLTEDKDFGELAYRLALSARCILLLRLDVTDTALKLRRLNELFATKADQLRGSFVVVELNRFRIRPLKTNRS